MTRLEIREQAIEYSQHVEIHVLDLFVGDDDLRIGRVAVRGALAGAHAAEVAVSNGNPHTTNRKAHDDMGL